MTGSYKKWAGNKHAHLEDLYRTANKAIVASQPKTPKAAKQTNFYIKKIDRKLASHSNRYSANRNPQGASSVNFVASMTSKPLNDKASNSLEKQEEVLNPEHDIQKEVKDSKNKDPKIDPSFEKIQLASSQIEK